MVGTQIDADCFAALRRAIGRVDETLRREQDFPAAKVSGKLWSLVEHDLSKPVPTFRDHALRSTITLNPPKNMRLPSNGIFFGSIISASRGSFITLAMHLSRAARDL